MTTSQILPEISRLLQTFFQAHGIPVCSRPWERDQEFTRFQPGGHGTMQRYL